MTEIPDWAGKRACQKLNENPLGNAWRWPEHKDSSAVRTVAKLIMQYEEPPVGPDVEAVKRIISAWFGYDDEYRSSVSLARAVAQYKKEKGNG